MKAVFGVLALAACMSCGFRGDLYMPYEGDKATFGVLQTGADLRPPVLDAPPETASEAASAPSGD